MNPRERLVERRLKARARRQDAPVCPYFHIKLDPEGNYYIEAYARGIALLRFVLTNKGTAFSEQERRELGLEGLLPPRVSTMEDQLSRAWQGYLRQSTNIERYQFLRGLQERQEVLFYALVSRHIEEMLPIIYTPTVGEAVESYSALFQQARGMTVVPSQLERIDEVMACYPMQDVRLLVVTDSSAILGIGDQGYGGLAISIGKLALYTVAGVSPFHTMPVSLDVGTDRKSLQDDPLYLGTHGSRLKGEGYLALMDAFVASVKKRWPRAVIQWEDLSKEVAFTVLDRYRDQIASFNDDIQGTGGVALAGLVSACKLKGERLSEQRFLVYGAGAGGIGVASAIRDGLMREGLDRATATACIWVLDSKGLLVEGRTMDDTKAAFAQARSAIAGWTLAGEVPNLHEVVAQGKITAVIGLSGQPQSFDEPLVRSMLAHTPRPIVFPLSNPTKLSEAVPADVFRWTDGQALVASGSPFDPVEHGGKTLVVGQGNNAFIFPGLGLGTVLSGARRVTDTMVLAASYALADYTAELHLPQGRIYPPVSELREVSRRVAAAVLRAAIAEGVATVADLDDEDIEIWVDDHFWEPVYLPVVPGDPAKMTKELS
jgi:malate dehydrogenase (oxaloacetate-decarboxylating)